MKIGIQTRLWGTELNRSNLPFLLEQVAAAGYDGFEIGEQHLDLSQPQTLLRLLENSGLEPVSIHIAGQYDQPVLAKAALERTETVVEYAARVGAAFVTVSGREDANKPLDEIQIYANRLNEIGELCRQAGMRLCHHNHYWEIVNDLRELKLLCSETDPDLVWLCLDVGWAQRAGGSAVEISRAFLDRIGYLHLRDTSGEQWKPVGQGQVDYPTLFQLICNREYPWQVVEQEPADVSGTAPLAMARALRDTLRTEFGI